MTNIVISGCGNIGSRLLQSVSNIKDLDIGALEVYGIDPFQSSLDISAERFAQENAGGHHLHLSTQASDLPSDAELLIVSVDAANRLAALTSVLEHCRPKAIILEKILFTKFSEFDTVQAILDDLAVPCWVNCSRNIWPSYQNLKEKLQPGGPITGYHVSGSDWSLGSNAIHFIAAFEYLSGEPLNELSIKPGTAIIRESKRAGYKDLTGILTGRTPSGCTLTLTSDSHENRAITTHLEQGAVYADFTDGQTLIWNGDSAQSEPFSLLYTSQLTTPITDILKHNRSDLPDYAASVRQHRLLFKALNDVFYGPDNNQTQCPVT